MKIKLLSDLHLEFTSFEIPYNGEDILILAGDISPVYNDTMNLVLSYLECSKDVHVIFVLGNHDFYGHSINDTINTWNGVKMDRFHFLQDNSVLIGKIRFYGSTMWTNMQDKKASVMQQCAFYLNDFKHIKKFDPTTFCEIHNNSRNTLEYVLEHNDEEMVIITHHLPTYNSISQEFKGHPLNGSYASTDLDHLMKHKKIKIWCHGHTHKNLDYTHNKIRVICNPRGYVKIVNGCVRRENPDFDETLIITV